MAQDYRKELKKVGDQGGKEQSRPTTPVASVPFPSGVKSDGFSDYVNAMYDAAENARTAQLEAAYNKAASDLAAARRNSDEQYRQANAMAQREAAKQAAGFRELANARGLNSGAGGQAALMQSNRLQNDLSAIGRAQAQTDAELEMRRNGLAREYQLQKQQLMAESAYNRNAALYNELVRNDAAKRQQEQFRQQMNLQMMQMAMAEQKRRAAEAEKAAAETGDPAGDPPWDNEKAYETALEMLETNGFSARPMTYFEFVSVGRDQAQNYQDYLNAYTQAVIEGARQ